jgi:DNA ligase-1
VIEKDGEGLMLREPNSKYEYRRVDSMLKVKVFHDEEAVVIGKEKGTGRCSNMMGALICKDKKGVEFKVGSGFTDA